jgi:type I restriction enzyme M protein
MAPDGTGGMLTVAEETLQQIAKEHGTEVATHLHSQEINASTYVICKAYCSMGKAARRTTSSVDPSIPNLANNAFASHEFDFMLSNPLYVKSWKSDLERTRGKSDMKDPDS